MDNAVNDIDIVYDRLKGLCDDDIEFLKLIEGQIPIVADVSRADILLYSWLVEGEPIVLAHARPHSVVPVYAEHMAGVRLTDIPEAGRGPGLLGRLRQSHYSVTPDGAPVVRQSYPVRGPGQQSTIGVLQVETNLLENERLRHRSPVFQRAVQKLQRMAQHGLLLGAEDLRPLGETSGIIVADHDRIIRYASGVASNLYRRAGYLGGLQGRPLRELDTIDDELARTAAHQKICLEQEEESGGRYWIKKAIPLLESRGKFPFSLFMAAGEPDWPPEVILIVRDWTESRQREREQRVQTALIQELHHRVKNDLQTIAALLRIQGRRTENLEAKTAINDAVSRILSVAVIHEFLSNKDARTINIKDVSQRILTQMQEGMLDPDKQIKFDLEGPPIYLPSRKATACVLVINELLQNAVEHAFKDRQEGHVRLVLQDEGDTFVVRVRDDGHGIPDEADTQNGDSLGLQIVQTLVQEDLKGSIEIRNDDGTEAVVTFPKSVAGGE